MVEVMPVSMAAPQTDDFMTLSSPPLLPAAATLFSVDFFFSLHATLNCEGESHKQQSIFGG